MKKIITSLMVVVLIGVVVLLSGEVYCRKSVNDFVSKHHIIYDKADVDVVEIITHRDGIWHYSVRNNTAVGVGGYAYYDVKITAKGVKKTIVSEIL